MYKTIFLCCFIASLCLNAKSNDIARYDFAVSHEPKYTWKIIEDDIDNNEASTLEQLNKVTREILTFISNCVADSCPEPKVADFMALCGDISTRAKVTGTATDTVEYRYEQRLWHLACAKMGVDDENSARRKIQLWWD